MVFIFDECHRSQFGETHKWILQFFSKAQLFGFTGTPIFAENAVGKQTTKDLFAECLHKYVITDAIADENVLRFWVEYWGRLKRKDGSLIDEEVPAINVKEFFENPDRIEGVVDWIGALISLRIRHVDLDEKSVTQNPREVATKFGKRIDTFFAKGFPEAESTMRAWITYLDEEALYGPDDPLFPATVITPQSNTGFAVEGFDRRQWKSTEPVRKIVNTAFQAAKLDSFSPHAFRHMLARRATKDCTVPELVAMAQNLGHSDVLTTLRCYGQISLERQRALITGESGYDVLED